MSEAARPTGRLDPAVAWTAATDAPLVGLALAREAGAILAWDDAASLYLLDLNGDRKATLRVPGRVQAAAISDEGSLVAALIEGPRLLLLDGELGEVAERTAPGEPAAVAVDPHGRYVAVGSKSPRTHLFNRHGRPAGAFETKQPLGHLRFIPSRPMLVGASPLGDLVAIELSGPPGGRLDADEVWTERVLSSIGRLAATGDGGMILLSCFNHGVQRYDLQGRDEGAYHLGGTATFATPDFAGRVIAVATLEGEIAVLNRAGNVRWRTHLPRPAAGLECDALGRFLIYGLPTGEIRRLDLDGRAGEPRGERAGAATRPGGVREPAWSVAVAKSDEHAETAVVTVLDEPPRVAFMTKGNRLKVFGTDGTGLGQAEELAGVGRFLRTAPGWVAAATDRNILLYDAHRNAAKKVDLSLAEITHLTIRPDGYGLAIVQERDRIGRATPAGRWVWKKELRSPVEDLALGPNGLMALTTDDGAFQIFDAAGEPAGRYDADPPEPLCLIEAPEFGPDALVWVSLARGAQVLRGHRGDGRVLWETPTPWEGWQLHRVGPLAVVAAPDGRTLAYDAEGYLRGQGPADPSPTVFFPGPAGDARRLTRQGAHLICADLSGKVHWRAVADEPIGPFASGHPGAAALIGRSLAFFPATGGT